MKHLIKAILILLVSLMPAKVSAYDFSSDGFYFNYYSSVSAGSGVIVTYKHYISEPDYNGDIVIPENVTYCGNTYAVVGIGSSAFKSSSIRSVEIPSSVSEIHEYAFCACHSLSKVIIPYSIKSIGKRAFEECRNLRSIEIPSSTNHIGEEAFWGCPLTDIYCYSTTPIICSDDDKIFNDYTGNLHVPAASLAAYFIAPVWCNFGNIIGDAIEPTGIDLKNDSLNIYLGKHFQLNASIVPANATTNNIIWKTTNHRIATVENGLVSAVGLGECDIVAICYGMKAICHLTVTEETAIITLDEHETQVLPNHMIILTPTSSLDVMPSLAVSSSDPTVAATRIINGSVQVVGIKEGTTTITVNAANGNSLPDSCLVTVYTEPGDLNCDGFRTISDVISLIDYILGGDSSQISTKNADVNGDHSISISDITTLIDILLRGN